MTKDLTGGLQPEQDYVFGARPDDPDMRQGLSMWISNNEPGVGFPRIGLEAVASEWDTPGYSVQVAFPDGPCSSRVAKERQLRPRGRRATPR